MADVPCEAVKGEMPEGEAMTQPESGREKSRARGTDATKSNGHAGMTSERRLTNSYADGEQAHGNVTYEQLANGTEQR